VVHGVGINESGSARLGMHKEAIVDKREGMLGDSHHLEFDLEGAFVFEHYTSDDAWITTSRSSARHIFSGQSFIREEESDYASSAGGPLDRPEKNWNDDCAYPPEAMDQDLRYDARRGGLWEEDPYATWNNEWDDYPQGERVKRLREDRNAKQQLATEAEIAFIKFRVMYQVELIRYISDRRRRRRSDPRDDEDVDVASVDLEDQFGAEWFQRFQKATRRLVDTEMKCSRQTKL
jgi:hypothetical protein